MIKLILSINPQNSQDRHFYIEGAQVEEIKKDLNEGYKIFLFCGKGFTQHIEINKIEDLLRWQVKNI